MVRGAPATDTWECSKQYGRKFPQLRERRPLKSLFFTTYLKIQELLRREEGQDLVEYALLITLIALAVVGGVNHVASAINNTFSRISTTLS
jgi:pilus assembly protein Flp/PilA